jgi:hypothetical protein
MFVPEALALLFFSFCAECVMRFSVLSVCALAAGASTAVAAGQFTTSDG